MRAMLCDESNSLRRERFFRQERFFETRAMLRFEIYSSRRERFFKQFFETRAMLWDGSDSSQEGVSSDENDASRRDEGDSARRERCLETRSVLGDENDCSRREHFLEVRAMLRCESNSSRRDAVFQDQGTWNICDCRDVIQREIFLNLASITTSS